VGALAAAKLRQTPLAARLMVAVQAAVEEFLPPGVARESRSVTMRVPKPDPKSNPKLGPMVLPQAPWGETESEQAQQPEAHWE
jgi:hypothetical protein